MNAVNTALFARMDGDNGAGGVKTLSTGGIHYGRAPQTKSPPYVIFQKQTGTPSYTFTQRAADNMLYLAKGVAVDSANEGGRKIAGTIAERIDAVLTDYALPVAGKTLLYLRKVSDVEYIENDPETKQAIYHVGGLFRIEVAPPPPTAATATITLTGVPANGGEILVGDESFTFVSGVPASNSEVSLSSGDAATIAQNLTNSINSLSGGAQCTAARSGLVLTLTANTAGTAGNGITLEDRATNLTVTGFSGGTD
jgi:hypothetical protein